MNTRNAYKLRALKAANRRNSRSQARGGYVAPASLANPMLVPEKKAMSAAETKAENHRGMPVRNQQHPLTDGYTNARLAHCEDSVKGRFDAIVPTLKTIAGLPYGADFIQRAQQVANQNLGFELPEHLLDSAWVGGVDMKALYAECSFSALKAAAEQFVDDLNQQLETVQDTKNFFLDCGFHAVDMSPCADGRLKGLTRYILRLPLSSFTRRKAYAGALFDVETDVHHWEETELRRFREGVPTTPDAGTRYLKVAVYHTSSSDPNHQGCAAHGSNEHTARDSARERLGQFREAIENTFCCGASTDILLIGVDTDTDAIKIHVPDGNGDISQHRVIDNMQLYKDTLNMTADESRVVVYEAINNPNQQSPGWGAGEGQPHEGMRKLIANLLINNLSQIDYVADLYGGSYPDIGHAERYISVGDGFDEVQMRNVAYYAHLQTLEEGVADMDVGIKIFTGLNIKQGLPIPVAIHYRYNAKVPGSRERTCAKAKRVEMAIRNRYSDLDTKGMLFCHLSVQDKPTGSPIETVEISP
uniref:Carboxysome shell carbonic anhydrase n=1 Tax=uncultured Thiotrichaceae bacterium TaxID=298394 RepID=A0A6S6TQR2_9GAMM|nr:MAG: carboxysome shell protein CsoS3 [uncultured Thiotrichaceae bacterium]